MTTLIIGDILNETDFIESVLQRWSSQVDEIVFLGDYFGGPTETKEVAAQTAKWLTNSTSGSTKRVHLLGNQDVDYLLFSGVPVQSSYTPQKGKVVSSIFPKDFAHSFKIAHHTQDWLLTHAGVTPPWLPGDICATDMKAAFLNRKLKKHLETPTERSLFTAGVSVGGINEEPSPLWCDWFLDFSPSLGVNQICAHTPVASTCIRTISNDQDICFIPFSPEFPLPKATTQNLCINTGLSQFILLKDGVPFAVTPEVETLDFAKLKPLIKWT
jgi:hypothetical protein